MIFCESTLGGMLMDKSRIVTLAVLCAIVFRVAALAQTTTGSIVGIVTDPGGASVPGATVTVTNEGTGVVAIKMTTDSSGNYVATTLPPGRYVVTVEAAGFKKSVNPGINLSVQDRIGLNVALEVGQLSETVEVTGAAQALQTDFILFGAGRRIPPH